MSRHDAILELQKEEKTMVKIYNLVGWVFQPFKMENGLFGTPFNSKSLRTSFANCQFLPVGVRQVVLSTSNYKCVNVTYCHHSGIYFFSFF